MLKKETQFIIYTAPDCPKCVDQKAKWDAEGIRYEERSADRIKNHQDDYDKEALVEASMNNMELPVIIKLFPFGKPIKGDNMSENSNVKK